MLNWVVPMLVRFPDASIRCVPAVAPVLIPVVPFNTVPVIVLAVVMVPNPDAIEPDTSAPTVVKDEVVTPDPKVFADRTAVPLMLKVFPDERLRLPVEVTVPDPPIGDRVISPVVAPPMVSASELVVARFPPPVKNVAPAPLFADREAVGVPPATFKTANFADAVVDAPTRRSRDVLVG